MNQMTNAVQVGNEVIITNQYGSATRKFRGILISFSNGRLTYKSDNGTTVTTYL